MSDRTATADMMARLERHYIKPGDALPGGIFVPECGRNGAIASRADALYVGFTSTSGRLLVGHEVKVSRADWRHELDKPGKSDAWADQCHQWYVVAPSTDIVPPQELPAGWGLMIINPKSKVRLTTVVKAETHRERTPSWTTVRSIMARQDTLRANAIAAVKLEALDTARAELAERQRTTSTRRLTTEESDRLEALERLENALGYKISRWRDDEDHLSPDRLAAAVALCRAADGVGLPPFHRASLDRELVDVRARLAALDEQLTQWQALSGGRSR